MNYRKLIPSSLLGRSLILIFVPLISVVILTCFVFYITSWNIITKRLSQSVVADINVIVKLIDQDLENKAIAIAKEDFKMDVNYKKDVDLNPLSFRPERGILSIRLRHKIEDNPKQPHYIKTIRGKGYKLICNEL